ncbi:MAG: BTAD domain-containing putative transcriptional regulator [Gemmatimonadales bacterium]
MLRLQTLGGLACSDEAGPLSGACAQRKPLGLLVLLAMAGEQGATREKLAGLFWGDHDEARARANLKQMLYLLRRDAGHSEIIEGTTTLRLNPALVSVDALEFQARCKSGDLAGATSLYAGPFLDGVFLEGSPELEQWCEEQREWLAVMFVRALAGQAEAALAAGDHQGSLAPLRRLVQTEPLEGKWVALLVRELEQAGELTEALRVAEQHCERIQAEVGTSPPAELVATMARLRRVRLDLGAAGATLSSEPHAGSPSAAPGTGPSRAGAALPAAAAAAPPAAPPRKAWRSWKRIAVVCAACLLLLVPALALRPRPVPARNVVPVVLIQDFEDRAGPGGSPAWATIFANRAAEVLSSRFEVVRDSARPGQPPAGQQDLTVAGTYFTAGDTLVVQTRLYGHGTRAELDTVAEVRALSRQVGQIADSVARQVRLAVERVVDTSRVTWGLVPADSVDAGAWTWFLLADKAYTAGRDCRAALGFIDSAVQADPRFAFPAVYRLNCYIPNPPYQAINPEGLARVRREIDHRPGELPATAGAYYRYLNARAFRDQDSVLAAARALVRAFPQSSRARAWLVAALLPQNRFSEVLEVTRPDLDGGPGQHDLDGWYNIWARSNALHLLGRYAEDLALVNAEFNRKSPPKSLGGRTAKVLTIRALAALGDTAGVRRVLLEALSQEESFLIGYSAGDHPEEELRAHGMTRLADTLSLIASPDRCASQYPISPAIMPNDSGLAEYVTNQASKRDSVRVQAISFLGLASRDLRVGCIPQAAAKLRSLQPPIPDSLYYQSVRGELAARTGDTATVREVSAWLREGLAGGRLDGWRPVYLQARLAAVHGDRAEALRLLSNTIRLGMPYTWVHTDPLWFGYGEDPTFRALLAR